MSPGQFDWGDVKTHSVFTAAEQLGISPPTKRTLDRYGLTAERWLGILMGQGWVCPICEKRAGSWATDHEHVRGWAKMPPEQRATFVRGVTCLRCNHRVISDHRDAAEVQRLADYLAAYEARRRA